MDFSSCVNTVGLPKYCTVTFDDSSIMCIVVMRPWLSGFIGSMKLHMIYVLDTQSPLLWHIQKSLWICDIGGLGGEIPWSFRILAINHAYKDFEHINPFVASHSDGHATLCRKRVFQINYSSYTHKTIYENVPNKLRNNIIRLDLVNRKPQGRVTHAHIRTW